MSEPNPWLTIGRWLSLSAILIATLIILTFIYDTAEYTNYSRKKNR